MRKIVIGVAVLIGLAAVWWLVFPGGNSRARTEREHGIKLPASAQHIQNRGDAWHGFLDRGASTMFEMTGDDLPTFISQLQINSRSAPVQSTGDPAINGYNVWPAGSPTFVPGNSQYGGFRRTWQGNAVPAEMLSCKSPKGDWLHVEIWKCDGATILVKMYTDWN